MPVSPKSQTANPRFIKPNLAIPFLWIVFGFAEGNQTYYAMRTHGHSYWLIVGWCTLCWAVCSFLTPPLLALGGKFPLERPHLARSIPVHLLAYSCFVLFQSVLTIWLSQMMRPYKPMRVVDIPWSEFVDWTISQLAISLFAYGTVVMVGYAFYYRNRLQEEARRTSEVESLLAKTELSVLKSQVQPHFLFNTLNSILSLVRKQDTRGAESTLLNLSTMLRYSLDRASSQVTTLADELEFVDIYLAIEQVRFSDRLQVERHIGEDTLKALVPSLLLQPLVENCIRHGLAPKADVVTITLRSYRKENRLCIEVRDDGAGFGEAKNTSGLSLANIRSRLSHLYGHDFCFSVEAHPGGRGVIALISIPFELSRAET